MNKKIIIIFAIVCVGFVLLTSPAFAKENVNVKMSTDKWLNGKGVILIKLVDDRGREILLHIGLLGQVTDSAFPQSVPETDAALQRFRTLMYQHPALVLMPIIIMIIIIGV